MIPILFSVLFAVAAGTSFLMPSPGELGKRFLLAQRLMVMGDFEGSVAAYDRLIQTPKNVLLRPERVNVEVGDERLPLKVAAAYQVASSYRRRGTERLAEFGDSTAHELGRHDLQQAARAYQVLADEPLTPTLWRERALLQMGKSWSEGGRQLEALAAYQRLMQEFPQSTYIIEARYRSAWALFGMKRWTDAGAAFLAASVDTTDQDRARRALFQAGECQWNQADPARAAQTFASLANQLDQTPYEGKRRAADVMQALRLNVDATERELISKAHIRAGDMYRELDSLDQALEWYRLAASRFPTEDELVRIAFLREAETWRDRGDIDAALAAYRRALEQINDQVVRALVQVEYMSLAYGEGRYLEAADAYRMYADLFVEEASSAGVSVHEARLFAAESLRQAAEQPDEGVSPDSLYQVAAQRYEALVLDEPVDSLVAEAQLGMGLCRLALGDTTAATQQYETAATQHPDHRGGMWAALQLARLQVDSDKPESAALVYANLVTSDVDIDTDVRDLARIEWAQLEQQAGRIDAALALLTSVTRESEEYGRVRLEMARLLEGEGRAHEAEEVLEQAVAGEDDASIRADLLYAWALIAFDRGDYAETLSRMADLAPADTDPALLGELFYVRGASRYLTAAFDGAYDDLVDCRAHTQDAALRRRATDLLSRCMLELLDVEVADERLHQWAQRAATRLEQDELTLARANLLHLSGRDDLCVSMLGEETFDDEQVGAEAGLLLGEVLVQLRQWDEALTALTTSDPTHLTRIATERRLYLLGMAAMNGGRSAQAVASFRQLLKIEPEIALYREAQLNLGRSLFVLGDHRSAARVLLELSTETPNADQVAEAAFMAGENLFLLSEYASALAAYDSVPEGARRADAALAAVWCLLKMKRIDSFGARVEQVAAQHRGHAKAREAMMLLGDYHYNAGDYAAARHAYERVVADYADSDEARVAGGLLVDLRDLEADLVYQAAMAIFDTGDFGQASLLLRSVAERYPDTLSEMAARCNLAVALEHLGAWQQALAEYEVVLEAASGRKEYREMHRFARDHHDWITEYRM